MRGDVTRTIILGGFPRVSTGMRMFQIKLAIYKSHSFKARKNDTELVDIVGILDKRKPRVTHMMLITANDYRLVAMAFHAI